MFSDIVNIFPLGWKAVISLEIQSHILENKEFLKALEFQKGMFKVTMCFRGGSDKCFLGWRVLI